MNFDQMGVNEWLLIAGAVVGPVMAVQAQKWIERLREGKMRREWVFLQLMATRQQRVSPDHVRALNSIDLSFYGARVLGRTRRIAPYQEVLDAWITYRRHLSPSVDIATQTAEEQARFNAKADELFVNLLEKLAVATGYDFKREELQSGSYAPVAHSNIENEQQEMRSRTLALLRGQQALPLDIRSIAIDQVVAAQVVELNRRTSALEEKIGAGAHA